MRSITHPDAAIPPSTPEIAALQHENARLRGELAAVRRICARHEITLDGLARALRDLRQGALALRAENLDLREAHRQRRARRSRRSSPAAGPAPLST